MPSLLKWIPGSAGTVACRRNLDGSNSLHGGGGGSRPPEPPPSQGCGYCGAAKGFRAPVRRPFPR